MNIYLTLTYTSMIIFYLRLKVPPTLAQNFTWPLFPPLDSQRTKQSNLGGFSS